VLSVLTNVSRLLDVFAPARYVARGSAAIVRDGAD